MKGIAPGVSSPSNTDASPASSPGMSLKLYAFYYFQHLRNYYIIIFLVYTRSQTLLLEKKCKYRQTSKILHMPNRERKGKTPQTLVLQTLVL